MILGAGRQHYTREHVFNRRSAWSCHTLELTLSGRMLRRSGPMNSFRPQENYTLYLTPPDTPYGLRGREEGEEIWLIFVPRGALADCLEWPTGAFGIPQLPVPRSSLGRRVIQAFDEACRSLSTRHRHRDRWIENGLDRLLLLTAQLHEEPRFSLDPRIQEAVTRLQDRLSAPHRVADLARGVHLSDSRFAHLFRRELGRSPMAYLEELRLDEAQRLLLRTDLRVKEIAACVGFTDPYYFSARFRKQFGRAPSAWRRSPSE